MSSGGSATSNELADDKSVDLLFLLETQTGALVSLAIATGCVLMLAAYLRSMRGACRACREAQRYVDAVAGRSADACNDFYGHVCGRWDEAPVQGDFVDDLRHHSWLRLRSALDEYPWKTRRLSWTLRMLTQLYENCQRELNVSRSLAYMADRVAETTGLSWDALPGDTNPGAWIDVLLRLGLVYNVRTLVVVDYELGLGCNLAMRPAAASERLSIQRVEELLGEVNALLRNQTQQPPSPEDFSGVVRLHADISTKLSAPDNDSSLSLTATEATTRLAVGSPEDWLAALARYTPSAVNITADCPMDLHSAKSLQFILELFFRTHRAVMALYLYVHLLNKASELASMAGSPALATRACRLELQRPELFAAWHSMSAYTLTSEETLTSVRATMAHVFVNMLALVSPSRRDLAGDSQHRALARAVRLRSFQNVFDDWRVSIEGHNATYAAFPQNLTLYDTTFIGALRLNSSYRVDEQGRCYTENQDQAELFALDHTTPPCVAAAVLVPPMFHEGGKRGHVYGSLGTAFGVAAAKALLRDSLNGMAGQQSARRRLLDRVRLCHGKEAQSLTTEALEELAAFALGLRAALNAFHEIAAQDEMPEKELKHQRRDLLKWSCVLTCNSTSALSKGQLCNMALHRLPAFYEAFRCHTGPVSRPRMVCASFL